MTGAPQCTCPAGTSAPGEFHAAACPFPQGVCEYCDRPTDHVLDNGDPCCPACLRRLREQNTCQCDRPLAVVRNGAPRRGRYRKCQRCSREIAGGETGL